MCSKKMLLALVSVLAMVSMASADIMWWEGSNGKWTDDGWRREGDWVRHIPTASDEARIDSSLNPTVLIDGATTAVGVFI